MHIMPVLVIIMPKFLGFFYLVSVYQVDCHSSKADQ